MKEYIKQFYSEGLANTFYIKPLNYLKKHIKNKKILKCFSLILKTIYTIFCIILAIILFKVIFPF